jgi:hypothetical protein
MADGGMVQPDSADAPLMTMMISWRVFFFVVLFFFLSLVTFVMSRGIDRE